MSTVFDLTKNKKQTEFWNECWSTVAGNSDKRLMFYGGGIRGGKTSVCLTVLYFLARKFPKSRWHIVRDSFPVLQQTTIPSFEKFYPESSPYISRYYRSSSNFHVLFNNGSRIFFVSENIKQDPELNWLLGVETNGFFLEQVEGLNEKVWAKALERTGSWYIDPMPPAFILATMNPTQTWSKDLVFIPWKESRLDPDFHYTPALPGDSPFITKDQWNAWAKMDSVSFAQFVEGDWEAFASVKRFAYAFTESKHVAPVIEVNNKEPTYLSFDFNHSPVTCIAFQHYDNKIRALREFSSTVGLASLCAEVRENTRGVLFVTGDRSGWNQSELLEGNRTAYDIISTELDLTKYQNEAPLINPNLFKSRQLVNSMFENYPSVLVSRAGCPQTIKDLKFVEADEKHKIVKDRNRPEGKADFLDCVRYYFNTYFEEFIRL
jgi:hypothetical protein